MIRITRENLEEVLNLLAESFNCVRLEYFNYTECEYEMYSSVSDVLTALGKTLEQNGINVYENMRPIWLKHGLGWNEEDYPASKYANFKDEEDKFCLEFTSLDIECVMKTTAHLKDKYKHLLMPQVLRKQT